MTDKDTTGLMGLGLRDFQRTDQTRLSTLLEEILDTDPPELMPLSQDPCDRMSFGREPDRQPVPGSIRQQPGMNGSPCGQPVTGE
jgi:hypothetical protein